jgi:hypothetical protein
MKFGAAAKQSGEKHSNKKKAILKVPTMPKKLRILFALLYAAPALAQTSTTSTSGVVNVTMPMQVVAPVGCAVSFSSADTVPVITISGCSAPP